MERSTVSHPSREQPIDSEIRALFEKIDLLPPEERARALFLLQEESTTRRSAAIRSEAAAIVQQQAAGLSDLRTPLQWE